MFDTPKVLAVLFHSGQVKPGDLILQRLRPAESGAKMRVLFVFCHPLLDRFHAVDANGGTGG
jgi:hypothetical protein